MSEEKTSKKTTSYYVKINRNKPQGPYTSYFNDDEESDEKPIEESDEESQETDEESDEQSDEETDEGNKISIAAYPMRIYHSGEITGILFSLNSSHQIKIWKNEEYKDIALKENNTCHIAGIKFMLSNDIKWTIELNMGSSIFGVEWTDMYFDKRKITEAAVDVLNYLHTEGYTLIK